MANKTKAKTKPPKATADHLKSRKRPSTEITVYLDEEAATQVTELERRMSQVKLTGSPEEVEAAEAELQAATELRDSSAVLMRFETIGRKRYDRLVDEHQPTEEQTKEWQEANAKDGVPSSDVPPYNPETFPIALIHATLVAPQFDSVEELAEVLDGWNENEFLLLWMAAVSVCNVSRVTHWGKG